MKNRNIGILLSYINSFASLISGIVMSIVLLRILGDVEYGLYQTIASFANCLVIFEFGTGTVMTRNLSLAMGRGDKKAIQKNVSTIWGITLVLSAIIAIFSICFYSQIGNVYSKTLTSEQILYAKQIFIVISVYLIVSFWGQTLNGIILAYEKYTLVSGLNISKTLLRAIVVLLCVFKIEKSIVIALVDMVISVSILLFLILYCRRNFSLSFSQKYFCKQIVKESAPLSCAIFLQAIVNQANSNVDKFLLGIKTSPEVVSLYSISMFIFNIFMSLTTIPISMYSPQIMKAVGEGNDREKITDIMIAPSRLIAIVAGTILCGFVVSGRQFIEIFYGSHYTEAWIIAVILMVPMYFNMVNGIIINILNAENRRIYRSCVLILTTIVNIILTFNWIESAGAIGAAAATSIATFIGQLLIMNIYYYRVMKIRIIRFYQRALSGILSLQVISMLAGLGIVYFVRNTLISMILGGCTYLVVFFVLFFFKGATQKEKIQMRKMFGGNCDK